MDIYTTHGQLNTPACPRSVALGVFDGLHPGHRQVILAAMQGIEDNVSRCVYTFDPTTMVTKHIIGRLCTPDEQHQLLTHMGVDELFEVDFAAVRHLSPKEFVQQILKEQLGAVKVTCGFNYRFGHKGAGDAAMLTRLCADCGIAVTVVPEVDVDGEPVNSTAIRQALALGDMATVRRLMGRPYHLQLPVTEGQHLGRKLGMPTINQVLPIDLCAPKFGVYVSSVQIDDQVYPAVTNIGVRPTVGTDAPLAETYILGYEGDLYGTTPTVYPLQYLRAEQTFATLDELKAQIEKDVAAAADTFAPADGIRAVLFDFDDTLDNRDAAFRQGLSAWIKEYYPSLPEEEVARRQQEMFVYQRGECGQIVYYRDMIAHFLEKWPSEVPADNHRALWRFYHTFSQAGQPRPDVIDTLTELRRRGYLTGIITNGSPYPQTCKIDHCGLRRYVDLVVLAGVEGIQKPNPAIFKMAAARLGVPTTACMFVGDHPINDVAGAIAVGYRGVGFAADREPGHPAENEPWPDGTPIISHVGDILSLLDY